MRGSHHCKDIPTETVLRFLAEHQGRWSTHWRGLGDDGALAPLGDVVDPAIPERVVLAKMRNRLG